MLEELRPVNLLSAYACGIFPMADEEGVVRWVRPRRRAVIPIDDFRATRSLRAKVRQGIFEVAVDNSFGEVMRACADRPEGTWISEEIIDAYEELHRLGFAHSVECRQRQELVGGLYGVTLGGAFFGESMFHRVTDASKVALFHLVERLRARGFVLLDVQFMTEHLRQFGTKEIAGREYERRLSTALELKRSFVDDKQDSSLEQSRDDEE